MQTFRPSFSPRPWSQGQVRQDAQGRDGLDVLDAEKQPVATVWRPENATIETMESNLHLVSTAAELFDVVNDISSFLNRVADSQGRLKGEIIKLEPTKVLIAKLKRRAMQVVRKASGRSATGY